MQKITKIARSEKDFEMIADLMQTYFEWRSFDPVLRQRQEPLDGLQEKYTRARNCFLIIPADERVVGGVGLQQLDRDRCEMKRLFVREDYWGKGYGRLLIEELFQIAIALDYTYMMLDSHPKMTKAQLLYRKLGFVEATRYNDNPVDGILFFQKILK